MASRNEDMPANGRGARSPGLDGPALRLALSEAAQAVRCYVFGMCGNWHQAEDITQGAMLKAWQKRQSFDGRADVKTWIFTIARNHWLDGQRKKRSAPHETMIDETQIPIRSASSPAEAAQRDEFAAAVCVAMAKLPPEQHEALALRESDGLTFPQIAKVLGIPAATVKSRVRYALKKLSAELKQFERYLES